jgi:hypothetical protein
VLRYAGHLLRYCLWIANLQSNFATCALTYAMLAPENASATMLIIVSNVHKHAAAALKNVEEWLDRLGKKANSNFFRTIEGFFLLHYYDDPHS